MSEKKGRKTLNFSIFFQHFFKNRMFIWNKIEGIECSMKTKLFCLSLIIIQFIDRYSFSLPNSTKNSLFHFRIKKKQRVCKKASFIFQFSRNLFAILAKKLGFVLFKINGEKNVMSMFVYFISFN